MRLPKRLQLDLRSCVHSRDRANTYHACCLDKPATLFVFFLRKQDSFNRRSANPTSYMMTLQRFHLPSLVHRQPSSCMPVHCAARAVRGADHSSPSATAGCPQRSGGGGPRGYGASRAVWPRGRVGGSKTGVGAIVV